MTREERLIKERDFAIETNEIVQKWMEDHFDNAAMAYRALQTACLRNHVLSEKMKQEFPYWG